MNLPRVLEKIVARYARNSLPPEVKAELKQVANGRWKNFQKRIKSDYKLKMQVEITWLHNVRFYTHMRRIFDLQDDADPRFVYFANFKVFGTSEYCKYNSPIHQKKPEWLNYRN